MHIDRIKVLFAELLFYYTLIPQYYYKIFFLST